MTELDDDLVPLALELIDELGQPASFTVSTKTPSPSTGTVTETGVSLVSRNISPPSPWERGYEAGDVKSAQRLRCYLAASGLSFQPVAGQKVTLADGQVVTITEASPLYSGEQVCAWRLGLER